MIKVLYSLLFCLIAQPIYAKYWISFCSLAGGAHAFVKFIKENETNGELEEKAYGFRPINNDWETKFGAWGVGTVIPNDNYPIAKEVFFETDQEHYNSCWKTMIQWQNKDYHFLLQDCVSFIQAVAKNLIYDEKIDSPPGTYLIPNSYIDALREYNLKISTKGYESYIACKSKKWKDYIASDKSCQLSYPGNWKLEQNVDGAIARFSIKKSPSDNVFLAQVTFTTAPIPNQSNIIDILKIKTKEAISSLYNSNLKSIENKNLLSYPGLLTDYTQTKTINSKSIFHTVSWVVVKDDKQYVVKYLADAVFDKDYLTTALAIINSLKITEKDKEGKPTNRLLASVFFGNWEGKLNFSSSSSIEPMDIKVTENFEAANLPILYISHQQGANTKRDTIEGELDEGNILLRFFTIKKDKSKCDGFLRLVLIDSNTIQGNFQTNEEDCGTVSYFAKRQVKFSDKEETLTFKIDPKYVTLGSFKTFKWYEWEKAPEDLKIATGFITTYKNIQTQKYETLKSEIQQLSNDCKVKIAAVDLDEDGICGLAVSYEGNTCCGTAGCMFTLYDNGGVLFVDLGNNHGALPQKNGVKATVGHGMNPFSTSFFPLKLYTHVPVDEQKARELFTYKSATKPKPLQVNQTTLIGGATPDAIGRILLKALQTNNKQLWINCIHPETDEKEFLASLFERYRKELVESGLTDWNLVRFSRVTFSTTDGFGIHVSDEYNGEKVARFFKVEFNYKEFLGRFGITSLLTNKKGKYFLYRSMYEGPTLNRYESKR